MAMSQQRQAIDEMLERMFALLPHLRPENQMGARYYLSYVWDIVKSITVSLNVKYTSAFLKNAFQDYIQTEEKRIKRNLEDVKNVIDGVDTLLLVTGNGLPPGPLTVGMTTSSLRIAV